jgi:hypothetical protein
VKVNSPKEIVRFIRRDDCVTVTVQLFGEENLAIVDSGASCCLVRRDLVASVVLEVCKLQLVDASNRRISVSGKCVLDVKLGDLTVAHEFVVADIESTMLLGSDFLFKNRCVVDFCRKCLCVDGTIVPFTDSCCRVVANLCSVEACRCPPCTAAGQGVSFDCVVGRRCGRIVPCEAACRVDVCASSSARICDCVNCCATRSLVQAAEVCNTGVNIALVRNGSVSEAPVCNEAALHEICCGNDAVLVENSEQGNSFVNELLRNDCGVEARPIVVSLDSVPLCKAIGAPSVVEPALSGETVCVSAELCARDEARGICAQSEGVALSGNLGASCRNVNLFNSRADGCVSERRPIASREQQLLQEVWQ